MSAANKGVFECKYDNENFNKKYNLFYLQNDMVTCTLFEYNIGVAKVFLGIMLAVIAKSGKEIHWLTKTEGVTNNTV